MPEMGFWYAPGGCSLAPHILLHEVGAPFEAVETSLATGAHLTDEFARINPKKRVPVLFLDGEVITEIPAIATAISDLFPEQFLMGRTSLGQARVYEWMSWLSGTLHGQGFGALWRPQRFSDDPTMFESIRAKGRKTVSECFDLIETRLSGPYSTGDAFSSVIHFCLFSIAGETASASTCLRATRSTRFLLKPLSSGSRRRPRSPRRASTTIR